MLTMIKLVYKERTLLFCYCTIGATRYSSILVTSHSILDFTQSRRLKFNVFKLADRGGQITE